LELADDDRAGLLGRVERLDEFELDGGVYERLGVRVVLGETEGVEVLGGAEGLTVRLDDEERDSLLMEGGL